MNLVTGASLPDEGDVRVFGTPHRGHRDGDDWLASLDRVRHRQRAGGAARGATLAQNLAMPFTLAIDPMPPEIARRVVRAGARVRDSREWLRAHGRRRFRRRPGARAPRARDRARTRRCC